MTKLIRWALVPITGLAVWYAGLFLGLAGVAAIESSCPPELVVSGLCTAWWYGPAVDALVWVCTALVAVGVVILPARIAPSRRLPVAGVAYASGVVFAIYAASGGSLWGPFLVAAPSGSGALWLASSRWRSPAAGAS